MRRIKKACTVQTIHIIPKDYISPAEKTQSAQKELSAYRKRLDNSGSKYKILSEVQNNDGSITIEVKKQYLNHPVGNYLD